MGEAGHAIGARINSRRPRHNPSTGPELIIATDAHKSKHSEKNIALAFEIGACFRAQVTMKSIAAVRIKTNLPVIVDKSTAKRSSALPSAPDTFVTPSHSAIVGRTRVLSHTPLSPQWGAPKNQCATKRARIAGFQKAAEESGWVGRHERLCRVDRLSRLSIATSTLAPTKVLA